MAAKQKPKKSVKRAPRPAVKRAPRPAVDRAPGRFVAAAVGDRVMIRAGEHLLKRGVVDSIESGSAVVSLSSQMIAGESVSAPSVSVSVPLGNLLVVKG